MLPDVSIITRVKLKFFTHLSKLGFLIKKEIDEHTMFLNISDGGISRTLFNEGGRELAFMELLKRSIRPSDTCVDIGSNIGYTTLPMLKRAKKIYAIEPDPRNLKILRANVQKNGYLQKCEIHQIGLSNFNGTIDFWLATKPNLNSMIRNRYSKKGIKIPVKTLSSFFSKTEINFIKMDIEGHEVEVLQGGLDYFSKFSHPVKILMEVHPITYDEKHSLSEVLKNYFANGFNTKYVVSTPIPIPKAFKDRGLFPKKVVKTDKRERGIYDNISNKDCIELCCYLHHESNKASDKVVRSIMIERN